MSQHTAVARAGSTASTSAYTTFAVCTVLLQADAREKVRHYGFAMKRSVDANKLQDALQNATLMISELRTSNLTPKVYYDLYMEVFDQLGA